LLMSILWEEMAIRIYQTSMGTCHHVVFVLQKCLLNEMART